jgi:polysaccharide export outer membrane protein
MREWMDWIPDQGRQRILWDLIWLSTFTAVTAWMVLRFVRQPALRASVVLAAAALTFALPALAWAARVNQLGIFAPATVTANSHALPMLQTLEAKVNAKLQFDSQSTAIQKEYQPVDTRELNLSATIGYSAIAAWGVVSTILLVRLAASGWALRGVLRRATTVDDQELLGALSRTAKRLNVRQPAAAVSVDVCSPTMVAFFRPTLLLPAAFLSTESGEGVTRSMRLDAVCGHELAHLRRRDGWAKLLLEAAVAILPWQPAMWRYRGVFAAASEDACDDWAIATGSHPVTLAAVLTEFISLVPRRGLGVAMTSTDLKMRILRLLAQRDTARPTTTRRARALLLVAVAVAALGIAVVQPVVAQQQPPVTETATGSVDDSKPVEAATIESTAPEYVIEPPDVLLIDALKIVPKAPYRVEPLDVLFVQGTGLLPEAPLASKLAIEPGGRLDLGPTYGSLKVAGLTLEETQQSIVKHLQSTVGIRSPEISVQLAVSSGMQLINGEHVVGPDGRVSLGSYGSVSVTGKTVREARAAIEKHLEDWLTDPTISVDVYQYKSKAYYIVLEDDDVGDQILKLPLNGNETVLDAIAAAAEKAEIRIGRNTNIWIARKSDGGDQILEVDFRKIVRGGSTVTNFRLQPDDRLCITQAVKPVRNDRYDETPETK